VQLTTPLLRIIPVLALLFLCSFLDRTNVGNARILGLEADLHLSNSQYNQGLAVFYATYIARYFLSFPPFPPTPPTPIYNTTTQHPSPTNTLSLTSEIPSNLVLKVLTPRVMLPLLTITWGLITTCLGIVRSYGSFIAVRAMLGLDEGGLLPGIVLYLSGMYTRGEMAVRIGVFYTAASLSGAFGGRCY
jgi:hypothetical protein